MNARFLLSLLLCISMGSISAQTFVSIKGTVRDASNEAGLIAVNIFNPQHNYGTFSTLEGQFEIKIPEFPTTLVFSSLGYENYLLKLTEAPADAIEIRLQPSSLNLAGVEVIATPKVQEITTPEFTVKDFIIEDNKILLVKYGGIRQGNFLELRELRGNIMHSLPIKMKGMIQYMHQSCLGNVHLVGSDEVIEVDFSRGRIRLVAKYTLGEFERYLKPCVDASEDFVYYKKEIMKGQHVQFDFISRKNRNIAQSVFVTDEENIDRMAYEFRRQGLAEYFYDISDTINRSTEHRAEFGISRPEHFTAWAGVFYKPLFSPLYNIGDEICVFNHTQGFLKFYTLDGAFKYQIPISYHKNKRWDKKILKDKKTNKFYTVYKEAGSKKFYEINFKDGTVKPAFKIDCDFVEKMIVYDNYLYYQDSNVQPGKVNRILHRVKATK